VNWWGVVIAVLGAYLIVSVGPWIALRVLEWLLRRTRDTLTDEEGRLLALKEGQQEHGPLWPPAPRAGRYEALDRQAGESLGLLDRAVAEAERILPMLAQYEPARLGLLDVLSLRAWVPLSGAIGALHEARALEGILGQGEDALSRLYELLQTVKDLPNRVRALLHEQRAESVRLSALCETELEWGTKGLDDVEREISMSQSQIEAALDQLSQATEGDMPEAIIQADALIDVLAPRIAGLDQRLEQVTAERRRAQDAMTQVGDALRGAEERWAGLQARGATEPVLARALTSLRENWVRLESLLRQQTEDAYRETSAQVDELQSALGKATEDLDRLDDLMAKSKEALEGNVKALADAQAACDAVVRQDVLLDPDRSLALIEQATRAYVEAERQRGLGTAQGYAGSLELAAQGAQALGEANERVQAFPGQVQQVRELLAAMQPQVLGESRSRADRLREQLQVYTRHWERGLNADAAEAISLLDQAEVDLERLAPNVRYQRRFRQTEIEEALDILGHARSSLDRSGELVRQLEAERERIEKLRGQMEEGLAELAGQTMPALENMGRFMLPDTRQHLEAVALRVKEQQQLSRDLSRMDYDEAVNRVLPALADEAAQVSLEHEQSVAEYEAMLKDVGKRLDRSWARIARLKPEDLPGPEEDVVRLSADYDAWQAEIERETGNLPALRDLMGPPATALQQRMENVEKQITDGRRRLESLQRDYGRRAQGAREARLALRETEQQSRWTGLRWEWAEAEEAWQEAVRMERASQEATKLVAAADALQQAIGAAEEAKELFGRVERQMSSALRRLDDELRAVNRGLDRASRQADEARRQGNQGAAAALETAQSDAQRFVQAAANAATLDDALRNLREARKAIEGA